MRDWQKLAVAGIAAIGAAVAATPASAAPAGLQTLEFASSADRPEVQLVDRRRNHRIYRHRRFHGGGFDDDGINLSFGVFRTPVTVFTGIRATTTTDYYYSDFDDYDDFWLHCHGKKWRKYGRIRCSGRWHRHYN